MLFYYLRGEAGGGEKLWGGEINLCPPKRGSKTDSPPPPRKVRNGRGPLPMKEQQTSRLLKKEFWGLNRPWRGRERRPEPFLSLGEFPLEGGRDEVSSGPRPPRWRERKGSPEKTSPASPEIVGRMVGGGGARRGRESAKLARNLRLFLRHREGEGENGPHRGVAAPVRPISTMTPSSPAPRPRR